MWTANPAIYDLASESFRLIAVIDERLRRTRMPPRFVPRPEYHKNGDVLRARHDGKARVVCPARRGLRG